MNVKNIRRAPPLWVLLDILMLFVIALVSIPMQEQAVSYKFLGLPDNSVLFKVELPLNPNQSHWHYFDFETGKWIEHKDVTPHGRHNFLCNECVKFLPDGIEQPSGLMVGLPEEMQTKIHKAFFEACSDGDCSPTLYIDKSGQVSLSTSG